MSRIILTSLLICTCLSSPILAQELNFQQEIDTIPVYVNGVRIHSPFAGGISDAKPCVADLDGDGDGDLLVGQADGTLSFFRNTGTPEAPHFTFETHSYANIDVGRFSAPVLADLDNDGRLDLLIGEQNGNINYYRNIGTATDADFMLIDENLGGIDIGAHSTPTLADTDGDGDLDLLIGEADGTLNFVRNMGTAANGNFVLETENYADIDVGDFSTPLFARVDDDLDFDLLVGELAGNVNFYRNIGTATRLNLSKVTENFGPIQPGEASALNLYDLNNDGALDLIAGQKQGDIRCFLHTSSILNVTFSYVTSQFASIDVTIMLLPLLRILTMTGIWIYLLAAVAILIMVVIFIITKTPALGHFNGDLLTLFPEARIVIVRAYRPLSTLKMTAIWICLSGRMLGISTFTGIPVRIRLIILFLKAKSLPGLMSVNLVTPYLSTLIMIRTLIYLSVVRAGTSCSIKTSVLLSQLTSLSKSINLPILMSETEVPRLLETSIMTGTMIYLLVTVKAGFTGI